MHWFRIWHDSWCDPKFMVVADDAKARLGDVLAAWWIILDYASKHETRGNASETDRDLMALLLATDLHVIDAIFAAFERKGMIKDGMVVNWNKRQPVRGNDHSTKRVQAFRERMKRAAKRPATRRKRLGNASDTDTDTDKKTPLPPLGDADQVVAEFEQWYALYPHKIARAYAEQCYAKARALATQEQLLAGLRAYIAGRAPDCPWANPATWLNGQRWKDRPAADHGAGKPPRIAPGARPTTLDPSARPWASILARYKPGGFWMEQNHGARPESDASAGAMQVPRDLLNQWRASHGLPPWTPG